MELVCVYKKLPGDKIIVAGSSRSLITAVVQPAGWNWYIACCKLNDN